MRIHSLNFIIEAGAILFLLPLLINNANSFVGVLTRKESYTSQNLVFRPPLQFTTLISKAGRANDYGESRLPV